MDDEIKLKRINFEIEPTWNIVKGIVNKTTQLLEGKDQDFISATVMCAVELIENAVKYGAKGPKGENIKFDILFDDDLITISVSHGIKDDRDLKRLSSAIGKIHSSDDPAQLYVNRLKELLVDPKPGESRLGLFRIAHEGKFTLDFQFVDQVLTVRAQRAIA